jgi:hypothetical protein
MPTGPTRLRPLLLAGLLLAGTALLVERLWVTDREAVEALVAEAEDAVRSGEFGRLLPLLDPGLAFEGRDAEATVRYVESLWKRHRPLGLSAEVQACDVAGDEAEARVDVRTMVLARPVSVRLDLDLRRTPDGWVVSAAEYAWLGP